MDTVTGHPNGKYTETLSPIAIGRIIFDRNEIKKAETELKNVDEIFFNWEETTIISPYYYQLIIGPEDTPYEGGFFFFKAQMPDNYPFASMKMKCETQGDNVRQHPNYYTNGKCCLSFLGTWSGPPWSACQNILSIAHTMKSIFTKNPIQNEPGWETTNNERSKLYERLVSYWTLKVAVSDMMISRPTTHYDVFLPIMEEKFIKYYPTYLKNLETFRDLDKKTISSPVYGFSVTFNLDTLLSKLNSIHSSILSKRPELSPSKILKSIDEPIIDTDKPINDTKLILSTDSSTESKTIEFKKLKKPIISIPSSYIKKPSTHDDKIIEIIPDEETKGRQVPNAKPSKFNDGYEMTSENNGLVYKVKLYPSGIKKWILK